MKLRQRLSVTTGLVAVPLVAGLFLLDERLRLTSMEESLRAAVERDLSTGLRDRCERGLPPPSLPLHPPPPRGPASGIDAPPGGPRPGPGGYRLFTYGADGTPAAGEAPTLPSAETSTFRVGIQRGVQLRFDIGGEGECALGLACMPPRPGQLRDQGAAVALAVLAVLGGVWIAVGPAISRMRRLAEGVRRSAASAYEQPVPVEEDDEVASLAQAFNEAGATVRARLTDVQAREETLRRFVADTTHDVSLPMTVLQGHLSRLDESLAGGGDPEAARAHVDAAIGETHYMASLLRNLAVATKLGDAGAPLVLAPVDVSSLVERVVGRHRPVARASKVDLNHAVPETPLVVESDATLLEQAVSNLVDNAIRYNEAGGHVAVVLESAADGRFVLTVTDDGPGVGAEELSSLTRRWFRGSEARTRRPDGKGLGLAIAAGACERLGLSLTFSRPDAGGLRATIAGSGAGDPAS